jgi:hypothetical protein
MGLDNNNINDQGVNLVAKTLRYLVSRRNIGIDIKVVGRNPEHTFSPYIRTFEYFRHLFEGMVSHDTFEMMKKEIESLKRPNNLNKGGIVDDDEFLDFILKCSSINKDSGLLYLKELFLAADVCN